MNKGTVKLGNRVWVTKRGRGYLPADWMKDKDRGNNGIRGFSVTEQPVSVSVVNCVNRATLEFVFRT